MPPRPWTPDEDATLLRMRRESFTLQQIAKHLGRSRSSVDSRLYIKLRKRTPEENEADAPRPWRVNDHPQFGRTVTRPDGITLPFVTIIHAHLLETV